MLHTVLATRQVALQLNCPPPHPNTHRHKNMQWGVEGNQAQGFLQSDRCGDRLSSQAETLNNLFSRRPGVTVTVARERNVSGQTETHTGEESIQNTVTPLLESRNTNFVLNIPVLFAISKK